MTKKTIWVVRLVLVAIPTYAQETRTVQPVAQLAMARPGMHALPVTAVARASRLAAPAAKPLHLRDLSLSLQPPVPLTRESALRMQVPAELPPRREHRLLGLPVERDRNAFVKQTRVPMAGFADQRVQICAFGLSQRSATLHPVTQYHQYVAANLEKTALQAAGFRTKRKHSLGLTLTVRVR